MPRSAPRARAAHTRRWRRRTGASGPAERSSVSGTSSALHDQHRLDRRASAGRRSSAGTAPRSATSGARPLQHEEFDDVARPRQRRATRGAADSSAQPRQQPAEVRRGRPRAGSASPARASGCPATSSVTAGQLRASVTFQNSRCACSAASATCGPMLSADRPPARWRDATRCSA